MVERLYWEEVQVMDDASDYKDNKPVVEEREDDVHGGNDVLDLAIVVLLSL